MLKKRLIISLTFLDGVLFRTKKFKPDYRYTKNFIDLWSIDELILIDISKNKFSKKFFDVIKYFSTNCHVPISVGGGIKSLENANEYFKFGADKIILGPNSNLKEDLIKKISEKYGNQSIIQTVDCIKKDNSFVLMRDSGKNFLSNDIILFCKKSVEMGAGEILVNNIDNDGSLLGYDIDLIKLVSEKINCPILALGGAGNWQHIYELFKNTDISAACTQKHFSFYRRKYNICKKIFKI